MSARRGQLSSACILRLLSQKQSASLRMSVPVVASLQSVRNPSLLPPGLGLRQVAVLAPAQLLQLQLVLHWHIGSHFVGGAAVGLSCGVDCCGSAA
eukprot:1884801-Rhodomonas_salina.1